MIKIINIFNDVEDIKAFEELFSQEVCPVLLETPGVEYVRVTSVFPMSTDISQRVEGIQLIIETYFESEEAINKIIHSPNGQKLMEYASRLPGELSIFVGKEKKIPAKVQEHSRNSFFSRFMRKNK